MKVLKKRPDHLEYLQPCAEVLSYSPEGIVCESDTERVGEEDGEW